MDTIFSFSGCPLSCLMCSLCGFNYQPSHGQGYHTAGWVTWVLSVYLSVSVVSVPMTLSVYVYVSVFVSVYIHTEKGFRNCYNPICLCAKSVCLLCLLKLVTLVVRLQYISWLWEEFVWHQHSSKSLGTLTSQHYGYGWPNHITTQLQPRASEKERELGWGE